MKDRRRSAVSIAAEIEDVGVILLVLRPYAALYIKLVCMAVTPGGSLFWRRYTRKPPNSLLKTCQQSTRITGTMSYGLMRWRLVCLVLMASSMCGSDQVRSTKISLSCLQSSMVVGMSWSKAACVLQVLESYISLRETWTPTCTVKYCSRAWFSKEDWTLNFKGMTTCVRLFYTKRLRNTVHSTFIFSMLSCLLIFLHKTRSNTNNFQTDLFAPLMRLYQVLLLRARVELGVMAMKGYLAISSSPELEPSNQIQFNAIPKTHSRQIAFPCLHMHYFCSDLLHSLVIGLFFVCYHII